MKDSLGDRMKRQYEDRTRYMLPRRTNTIIRLDGKAWHTYTRGRQRPWDQLLHWTLVVAATELCQQAQGCQLAYVQSDEVSLLLTDHDNITTEAWFDGNFQKITSVSASILTGMFNRLDAQLGGSPGGPAYFDARAFTIPDPTEVHNYFVWRQKDAERNSLSALAQAHFPQSQLHGKKRPELLELLDTLDVSWDDQPGDFKRGTLISRTENGWSHGPASSFTVTPPLPELLGPFDLT